MLTLGTLLRLWSAGTFSRHETRFAAVAMVLVLWHPFTTALFVGFYFGHYLDTFRQRSQSQHGQSLAILALGVCTVAFFVFGLPRLFPDSSLLPFGGGIGTPIHALFVLIVAAYATALAWSQVDEAFARMRVRYLTALVLIAAAMVLFVRAGIDVPGLTSVARPLLVERERTFQLESALAWLHKSEYCAYAVGFVEEAGNPIESIESAISRRFRPPASLSDVRLFWNTALRCSHANLPRYERTAIVTFGGGTLVGARPVFEVDGRYGGSAIIWILDGTS
jgi:hypothetical protein